MADDIPRHGVTYRIIWMFGILCLAALLFFAVDVKHRISGYRATHGGIEGTVTVTHCDGGAFGVSCKGDFRSDDGSIVRSGITVNGAPQALHWHGGPVNAQLRAAVDGDKTGDAWTVDGAPWLHLSRVQTYLLVPIAAGVLILWLTLRQGVQGIQRARERAQRRELNFYRRMFTETPRSKRR